MAASASTGVTSRTTVLMYAHPSMENLAKSIVQLCSDPSQGVLESSEDIQSTSPVTPRPQASIHVLPCRAHAEDAGLNLTAAARTQPSGLSARRVVLRDDIKWNNFADGFPKIFIENVKDVAGRDLIFIASFHSPEVIFEQISVIYAIPRYLARSVIIILPFFPTGTMERVDKEGQIATAKTLATLLSHIPLTARGPTQIMIFDIHALQERFYFADNVIPRLESAIPLLLRKLRTIGATQSDVSIVFPDDGATKRFGDMFNEYKTITCAKVRNGDHRDVVVKDGDPNGQYVIIVDDLVQTGGTLIECAKACIKKGAIKVSCYVTHAVFPKKSWEKFLWTSSPQVKFESFWITDSLPHAADICHHRPFELLSLCDVIADKLLGYDLTI